tara:strand:+ start:1226 stop:2224 length:999 start_codon:yes stop_codon:yes gene_type:complete
MATPKEYAYYIKGNKIAVVEKNTAFDNDPNSRNYGPGTRDIQWESPLSTVADALEIEYTYAPTYNIQSPGAEGTDYHRFLGWGSDGANLVLFTYGVDAVVDLSSLFAADDWINIEGSGRWSGLHQVKSAGSTTGVLTLKTKCNLKPSMINARVAFTAKTTDAPGKLDGYGPVSDMDIEAWKDMQASRKSPYVFIDDAVDATNNGVFEVNYVETSGQLDFVNKITIDADGDFTSTEEAIAAEADDTIKIYNMYYEQIIVNENIEVMEDESFELDLPSYLNRAIVFYLKAKQLEDVMEVEGAEYFMAKFRKLVEEDNSNKKGKHRVMQGHWNLL